MLLRDEYESRGMEVGGAGAAERGTEDRPAVAVTVCGPLSG